MGNRNDSKQLNIWLRPGEKETLEVAAQRQGKTVTEWSRNVLLESVQASPSERRILLTNAIGAEVTRLSLIAVQDQKDLSLQDVRQEIERVARASAEGIVTRWLGNRSAA